jgi:hypothetical protein
VTTAAILPYPLLRYFSAHAANASRSTGLPGGHFSQLVSSVRGGLAPTVDAPRASYLRWHPDLEFHFEAAMPPDRSSNLIRAIATDVHFWIPLSVLLGGLLLLDKLR